METADGRRAIVSIVDASLARGWLQKIDKVIAPALNSRRMSETADRKQKTAVLARLMKRLGADKDMPLEDSTDAPKPRPFGRGFAFSASQSNGCVTGGMRHNPGRQ